MKKTTSTPKPIQKRQKVKQNQSKSSFPKSILKQHSICTLSIVNEVIQVKVSANEMFQFIQKNRENLPIDLTSSDGGKKDKSQTKTNKFFSKQNLFKKQEKQTEIFTTSIVRFEKRLRENWFKNPGMEFSQFFELAKKQFMLVDPSCRQFVNLNKRWCLNYFKALKGKRHLPDAYVTSAELIEQEDNYQIAETIQDILQQSENTYMQKTVENSSELWRKHTLKLLYKKYPGQKEGGNSVGRKEEHDMYLINENMKKTLENRNEQMHRLQRQANLIKNFSPFKVVFNPRAAEVQNFFELQDIKRKLNHTSKADDNRDQICQNTGVKLHISSQVQRIYEGEVKEQEL